MRLSSLATTFAVLALGTAASAAEVASGELPAAAPATSGPPALRAPSPPVILASIPAQAAPLWSPPPPWSAPAPACVPEEAAAPPEAARFITGELAHVGQTRLTNRNSRAGVGVGFQHQEGFDYMMLTPGVDLRVREWELGIAAPLRLEMCQGDVPLGGCIDVNKRAVKPFANRWAMKPGDWSGPADYLNAIRYLSYGHKEDRLSFNATQQYATTLGHGGVMRRYFPNADVNQQRVSAELDADGEHAGVEAFANSVLRPNIVGVVGYVRPLAVSSDDPVARSFSLGLTYVTDQRAPTRASAGADLSLDVRPDDHYDHRAVTALGVNAELRLLRTEHWDVKPYLELDALQGAGSGVSVGVLTRGSFGGLFAVRLVGEARSFGSNYQPGYFDTFYEVQKLQYRIGKAGSAGPVPMTKWEAISTATGPHRTGMYAEATVSLVRYLALSAGYEGAMAPSTRSAFLHAEVPVLDWLQFFATLYRRDFQGESFLGKGFLDRPNTLFFSGARLKILPFLFLNGGATQTYAWEPGLACFKTARGYSADADVGVEF